MMGEWQVQSDRSLAITISRSGCGPSLVTLAKFGYNLQKTLSGGHPLRCFNAKKIASSVVGIALSVGCGKKDEKSDEGAQAPTGALAIMQAAETALVSALTVPGVDSKLAGGVAGVVLNTKGLRTVAGTDYCANSSGMPIHADASKNDTGPDGEKFMSRTLAEYPGSLFYCKLNKNTYNFTTVLGAPALAKTLICGGGENLVAGAGPVRVSMKSDNPCVVDPDIKAMIDASSNDGGMDGTWTYDVMMVKPSARAADGWDYDVYAGDLSDGSQAKLDSAFVRMSFKASGAEAGFMFYTDEPNGSGFGGDTFQLMFKVGSSGQLRFETRRQFVECTSSTSCNSGNRKYTRHSRMFATGSVDSEGKFSSLSNLSAVDSSFDWNSSQALTEGPVNVEIFTMNGNATSGFLTSGFNKSSSASGSGFPATFNMLAATSASGNVCYGGDGTCAGVTALKPAADADMAFFLDPRSSSTTKPLAWFKAAKPLAFTSLTFAESQE
ncbi:MAG: hypothetical protein RIQ81_69 [Pseudomonadota bacterium]|jgi:hypothetical protein